MFRDIIYFVLFVSFWLEEDQPTFHESARWMIVCMVRVNDWIPRWVRFIAEIYTCKSRDTWNSALYFSSKIHFCLLMCQPCFAIVTTINDNFTHSVQLLCCAVWKLIWWNALNVVEWVGFYFILFGLVLLLPLFCMYFSTDMGVRMCDCVLWFSGHLLIQLPWNGTPTP